MGLDGAGLSCPGSSVVADLDSRSSLPRGFSKEGLIPLTFQIEVKALAGID
jgi:hypothetical protein